MRRHRWLFLVALPALLVPGLAVLVVIRVQHSLDRAGAAVAQEGQFPFEMRTLGAMENPGFEAIASPAAFASGAFYHGKLYVAGSSGLFVYGGGDALLKSYRVGVDLPAAALGQMVVARLRGDGEPELAIATSGEGVLLFTADGNADGSGSFRQIWPRDAEARDVTALLPLATGELLIGTRRRGLLVYRGTSKNNTLETFHPQLAGLAITALAADETGFWLGTRDKGLRHWHAGQIDSFGGSGEGKDAGAGSLPDDQVDAIAVDGDRVFVGTPLGVEEFDGGRPARVLARNLFASALFADQRSVTIGSMDQGIARVSLESERRRGGAAAGLAARDEQTASPALQFLHAGSGDSDALYAVMRDGLWRQRSDGGWAAMTPNRLDTLQGNSAMLTDGNISALAFGADGRLWVGYFDRGLDILSVDGRGAQAAVHREDDHLFCVNRIVLDPRRGTMAVATANGLVLFDARNTPRQMLTRRDGLIADHVTDIAFDAQGMVLATPAGLTFVNASGTESLYGFQGLVNNHVYALGVQGELGRGETLLAGTLGGVSVLKDEAVERNLTAANSGLKHNWVTAIVPVGGAGQDSGWMVGTYGAGVMRLGKDGLFTAMDGVTTAMVVNPNAMLVTDGHVFAGTLGKGLWVYSRAAGRWRQVTAGLPSENVTALAEHGGELYVGTENGLVRIAERLLE